ncbi:hypothetical protein A2791_04965 [Candidatus Saccharibacteria bacterium RIFCSPHIGHO2_01_FULL_46_30]|nr:MAG: hypothetical protein A2791_04965 [Candidatus Saccharibacteria bacterium RIFCSPHIGHO2_01_FULL_46_30]
MQPTLQILTKAIQDSWSAETAYNANNWSRENKARGQCVVSSLVVQDYFGGDLIRYEISEGALRETHYMNRLDDGTIIDTTNSQYRSPVGMRLKPTALGDFTSLREKRLDDKSTADRYTLLKKRVSIHLSGE